MNRAPKTWLVPTAFVAYVALSAARGEGSLLSWTVLLAPVGVAFGLRWFGRRAEAGFLATSVEGVRLTIIGLGLYLAAVSGTSDSAALRAASGVAQGLVTVGALLCIARLSPPPGLLRGHPAARSLDALGLGVVLWATASATALLRTLAPDDFPLDPIALDTAYLFGALGSLLLLCASLVRTRVLRGLELGVGDRANAGLSLAICGTIVGAGSGLVRMATSDKLAGGTLVATASAIVLALSVSDPSRVSRTVRGFVALLLLGTPTALLGAWIAMRTPDHPATVALLLAAASMIVGLVATKAARPLGPEGSRWLGALTGAMDAALHPEPEMALRAALMQLRKAEPASKARPEIFRFDPPGMLSVDIAGYLTEKPADTPEGVLDTALDEPSRTLRLETILAAQVRIPSVRPLVTWFEAHRAKTATVLTDEAGPIGLLVLPRGRRKSSLAMEEADLLGRLAQRLSGLISVTASLKRARTRELDYQKQARAADQRAEKLSEQLSEQRRADRSEAEARVEVLRAAAHSPIAQIKRQEIEDHALSPRLRLHTPLGVDPVPWAAHAHLHRDEDARPLVVLDCSERGIRNQEPWSLESETSPWRRAQGGTLVMLHPGALPEPSQLRLAEALEQSPPSLVISCAAGTETLVPRLARQLDGPTVVLPTLAERGEDLQALIINELAHLGITHKGDVLGIDRAALYRLIQRKYPGNDAELRGILASAAGYAQGARITLADLEAISAVEESELPPQAVVARSRARVSPRARRR